MIIIPIVDIIIPVPFLYLYAALFGDTRNIVVIQNHYIWDGVGGICKADKVVSATGNAVCPKT